MTVPNSFDIDGKVCVITGGSGVLGSEMAKAIGENGGKVALLARGEKELEDTRAELAEEGIDVITIPASVLDRAELDAAADGLRDAGRHVTVVGGDDWEPVASMLPTLRAANLVVCPGYSTVMEAAVAGTPTLIYPFTSEQRGVARLAARATGFRTVTTPDEVVAAAAAPPDPPAFENGAGVVANAVLS